MTATHGSTAPPSRSEDSVPAALAMPSQAALERLWDAKYSRSGGSAWGPPMRRRFGYYNPDDQYEALLDSMITSDTRWLDVGCGREVFISNQPLAHELSQRCAHLTGVDPDETLEENVYVHERFRGFMEEYSSTVPFDLISMRMVAEHVQDPPAFTAALARLLRPGGHAVIYTVNAWSPVPIATRAVPMTPRHHLKRLLWGTDPKDTFPTVFKMNSRHRLQTLMHDAGFDEVLFAHLDDCRTFSGFKPLAFAELSLQKALRGVGLRYPENCLLGVYRLAG